MSSAAAIASAVDELSSLSRPMFSIGNAGDEVIERQVNGHIYRWEPWEEKAIGDQMDYPRDKKGGIPVDKVTGKYRVAPSVTLIDSLKIVRAIFSEEAGFQGGNFGLYLLRNDGKDEARRKVARDAYRKMRAARAERKQAWWVELSENQKPGSPPLVAPKHLRDDIAFLAAERAGLIDRKAFWSFYGDFESDSRDEVVEYLRVTWPAQWAAKGQALIVSRADIAPTPQAVRPVAPSATAVALSELPVPAVKGPEAEAPSAQAVDFDEEQLDYINDEAEKLGTRLTGAEVKAIVTNDAAGIDALMERLAALKAAAEGGKQ